MHEIAEVEALHHRAHVVGEVVDRVGPESAGTAVDAPWPRWSNATGADPGRRQHAELLRPDAGGHRRARARTGTRARGPCDDGEQRAAVGRRAGGGPRRTATGPSRPMSGSGARGSREASTCSGSRSAAASAPAPTARRRARASSGTSSITTSTVRGRRPPRRVTTSYGMVSRRAAQSSAVISSSPCSPRSTTSSSTATVEVADVDEQLVHRHRARDRAPRAAHEHLAPDRTERAGHAVGVADRHRRDARAAAAAS